jgi:hypothetical protein
VDGGTYQGWKSTIEKFNKKSEFRGCVRTSEKPKAIVQKADCEICFDSFVIHCTSIFEDLRPTYKKCYRRKVNVTIIVKGRDHFFNRGGEIRQKYIKDKDHIISVRC